NSLMFPDQEVGFGLSFCEKRFHPARSWSSAAPLFAARSPILCRLLASDMLSLSRDPPGLGRRQPEQFLRRNAERLSHFGYFGAKLFHLVSLTGFHLTLKVPSDLEKLGEGIFREIQGSRLVCRFGSGESGHVAFSSLRAYLFNRVYIDFG